MASIVRKEGERHQLTVGLFIPVLSFGNLYNSEVIELKARTALIRYVNKGGKEYTLRVKRDDIAAPTAAQKAATEQSVTTRKLRANVRWRTRDLEYATTFAEETLESINAKRAETRAIHAGYGWKIEPWNEPMTPEQYVVERAARAERRDRRAAEVAEHKAALAAHEAAIKGGN